MNMDRLDLSILIVSYNTKELLLKCLGSIVESILYFTFEIIVIDNNSSDGTIEAICKNYPQVKIIVNKENVGFAKANNQGISLGKGRYYLLLNPDTMLLSQAIDSIVDFLDKNNDVGILGPKLLHSNFSEQISVKKFPFPIGEFMQSIFLDKIIPKYFNAKFRDSFFGPNKPTKVDWVTGACLAIRRQVIEDTGLLDEHFFLYYEEVDFCYRAKKAGWKIYFYPSAKIIHIGGQSTKENEVFSLVAGYKSKLYFLKKHYSAEKIIAIEACTILGFRLRKIVWQIAYFFKIDKTVVKHRISAYRSILAIKTNYNLSIDVSSMYRSRAGVGCYTRNLINRLEDLSRENPFLILKMNERKRKIKKRKVFLRFSNAIRHILWEQIYLPFLLSIKGASVFHSPAFICPIIKICPTVVTIHDMAYFLYPDKFVHTYRLYLKFWVSLSGKIADKIITDSKCSKEDIVRLLKIPESKIEVVYLGKDSNFRVIPEIDILENYKKSNNLPKNYILYVGTIEPRKNIPSLLKAYRIFKNACPSLEYSLIIAGEKGWMYSKIFDMVEELNLKDNVRFLGYVSDRDLPLLYNSAQLFVYPSLYEGFGLPPLEAMACGVPVITSNTSSLPEIVGDAGVMVDPLDETALASAISRVLNDSALRDNMIKNGIKRAEEFSWEKTAEKSMQIYQKLLAKQKI